MKHRALITVFLLLSFAIFTEAANAQNFRRMVGRGGGSLTRGYRMPIASNVYGVKNRNSQALVGQGPPGVRLSRNYFGSSSRGSVVRRARGYRGRNPVVDSFYARNLPTYGHWEYGMDEERERIRQWAPYRDENMVAQTYDNRCPCPGGFTNDPFSANPNEYMRYNQR